MAITTRDAAVVNFINDTHLLMTSNQIARYFYKSNRSNNLNSALVVARRRLVVLSKGRYIKRIRDYSNQEYIYYQASKPPKKIEHKLLMSEFLTTMKENNIHVVDIQVEYRVLQKSYGLRPDLKIILDFNGIQVVAFVEVDRTKTFTNKEKYMKLIESYKTDDLVKRELTRNFILISVCDKKPDMERVFWIRTDMSNFSKFKFELFETINQIQR